MPQNSFRSFFQKYWKALFILFFVSALAYLPNISKFTLYKDDWYYIVDGFFGGPKIFREMFYIDRPLRGYLFEYLFRLFGTNPLPYQILAYTWRLLSGFVYFWLLNLIWPNHKRANLWIAIFFMLYPGYLWWVSGVEYQPFMLTQFLQGLSFVTMLLFMRSQKIIIKLIHLSISIVTGWVGLLLVDYTIGMELFRFVIVFIVVSHELPIIRTAVKIKKALLRWLPFIMIPAGFMIWRIFFFNNTRSETDISLQIGQFIAAPIQVGKLWLLNLIKSFVNINLMGWIKPFYDNFFSLGLMDFIIAVALSGLAIFFTKLVFSRLFLPSTDPHEVEPTASQWEKEAICGGIIGIIGGIIPIVIMNREVDIASYSHYLLNTLFAAVPFFYVLINWIKSKKFQQAILLSFLGFLILSNYSYSVNVVKQERSIADFWKQVVIRAPGFERGTTFLVNLPNSYGKDNWDAVWAPVNYLYADPNNINISGGVVNYPYAGLKPDLESSQKILTNNENEIGYRTHLFFPNFKKLVVISQPSLDSCVHIFNSQWPRITISDSDQVLLAASKSELSTVSSQVTYLNLDEKIFGKVDDTNWCTIYQQAELALQLNQWDQLAKLQIESEKSDFSPKDQIEWMPFLQAAFYRGNADHIKTILKKITDPVVLSQACTTYQTMQAGEYYSSAVSMDQNKALVCSKG